MNPNVIEVYGGVRISRLVRVPQFQVGDLPFHNADLLVLPSAGNPRGFAGAIGVRLFSRADVELDIAGKKLRVFSQDCPGVYWTNTPHVEIPLDWQEMGFVRTRMQLDGQPVRVAFEPNEQSSIGMNAMHRLFGLDANSPGMTPAGEDAKGRKLFRYPFKALAAEGLTISNPGIVVVDQPPSDKKCDDRLRVEPKGSALDPYLVTCSGGADIVLGFSVLSKLHMYFAIKEKVLYLTGADAR
jgi:hypothetical protein